ncbi:diguanylate cyclase [Nocardia sp. XZ_19_385]|uniref:GGDEF domain-containing protein n=1 Tax=Nocardia sp. XZ_19_385 TaxID=2769488 RepID=UPI00188EFCFD|nr:GGDEF domain-containing protein [Nocardia sp. XZ_19_385]
MSDNRSLFRRWWRDRVDYDQLVETFASHGALGPFKFMLGTGGLVMLCLAVLAPVAQGDAPGLVIEVQGVVEAAVAGVWMLRWWFFPWPREYESLAWIVLFDLDTAINELITHDRVIGVLGIVLLAAMGGYVAVFHGPRILALHIGWTVLTSVLMAGLMIGGRLPANDTSRRADIAVGLGVVLVMVVVVGVVLPFMQFSHWLLRVDALSDPLTGLLNRRGLDAHLSSALNGRGRRSTAAFVATLDLDRFKAVNDTYGHPFGDEVLIHAAQQLREAVEPDALVARTGGEEFVVVGSLSADPAATGERLRQAIASMSELPVTITASVGVAVLDASQPHGETYYGELLRDSDSAMYRAKHEGGNAVHVAATKAAPADD